MMPASDWSKPSTAENSLARTQLAKAPSPHPRSSTRAGLVKAQLPADIDGDTPQPAVDVIFDRAAGEHRLAVAERARRLPVGFGIAVHSRAYRAAATSGAAGRPR